jgi:copper chaperone NosL
MRRDLLCLAVALAAGCTQPTDRPAALSYGAVACDYCRMTIAAETHAAQVTRPRGSPRAFDEPGCLVRFAAQSGLAADERAWVHAPAGWLDARRAWYAVPDAPSSGMMYGVTAHADSAGAAAALRGGGRVARFDALVRDARR